MSSSTTKRLPRDPREVKRAAVLRVEEQLALMSCSSELREAWAALVEALALGQAPQLRECPSCGNTAMRAATRCGYCWVALTPPA